MTAYEFLLSLAEDQQSRLKVNLRRHILSYGKKLLFDGKTFTKEFTDTFNQEFQELIPAEDTTFSSWTQEVATLYEQYALCYPKKRFNAYNFIATNPDESDLIFMSPNFHHDRLALELYILFHYAKKDLEWPNINHFFVKIADNCIVYRDWLI